MANNQKVDIDFDVHYLMQELNGKLHIFGWISGNEQEPVSYTHLDVYKRQLHKEYSAADIKSI